ncbi:Hint domain-containing protein [Roseinatronobacter thiooxidans]|uniref:Hint domain-containing protein n=1 Tax=Roseinatronobacter thiooxidans TaxID=121821 RepID=A0A2W7Q0Z9_9RHOB|nr:Hint domain-containing protein [Roseinatronobacter thiooxidans]PZX41981.1 Hint domain-containing protein [Roseinatronobacter thiooxidans]
MTTASPHGGVFAIEWDATQIDGMAGIDPSWLRIGASWQWTGTATRLDANSSVLPLFRPIGQRDIRAHARVIAHRLTGTVPRPQTATEMSVLPAGGFILTDGTLAYSAQVAQAGQKTLVVFDGPIPPQGKLCWITHHTPAPKGPQAFAQDVICFASHTLIATPQGPKPVAQLRAGDKVLTRDNGPQPVLWLGQSNLSGLALRRNPHLRPVRLRCGAVGDGLPDEDLYVSPAHRIIVSGPKARALFGCDEVLVRAGDMVNYTTITQDPALHGVVYMHLLLEAHQILFANGVPTESFHPALAPAQTLREHKHALRQLCPAWVATPDSYGPPARRCLQTGEAALLAA